MKNPAESRDFAGAENGYVYYHRWVGYPARHLSLSDNDPVGFPDTIVSWYQCENPPIVFRRHRREGETNYRDKPNIA
jgi:hypothetical protein